MKSTNMLRQDLFVCNCILIQVNINTGRRAWKFALMQTYLLFVASVCVCYMLGCKQKVSVCEKKHLSAEPHLNELQARLNDVDIMGKMGIMWVLFSRDTFDLLSYSHTMLKWINFRLWLIICLLHVMWRVLRPCIWAHRQQVCYCETLTGNSIFSQTTWYLMFLSDLTSHWR